MSNKKVFWSSSLWHEFSNHTPVSWPKNLFACWWKVKSHWKVTLLPTNLWTCPESETQSTLKPVFFSHSPPAEPASTKENNCLNAAKACNLNDTCKKYRSAYINPCTSRVSASEVCNKRKCHKALRQFFDKVIGRQKFVCHYIFFLVGIWLCRSNQPPDVKRQEKNVDFKMSLCQ